MDNCFLKNCLPGCLTNSMILALLTSIMLFGCNSKVEKTTIYFGGDILTMSDSADKTVESILIKNEKIVSTGSKEDIFKQKKPDTILVDLKGKTLMPGFISEIAAIKPFSAVAVKEFDIVQNTVNVFDAYMENGFTAITTMGLFATDKKPFLLNEHLSTGHPRLIHKVLDLIGMLPDKKPTIRHFVYIKHDTPFLVPETVENGDDFFKVVGIKLWYDGSPYTGSMYLRQPYLNSELMLEGLNIPRNHYGSTVIKKDDFYKAIKKYHDLGWQLSVHSQGDKSTEEVLELLGKMLSGSDRKGHRHRIEHGVLMPPELLGEMKNLNITVSYHINHLYYYGLALKNEILGDERAEKMLPVNSTKKSGVIFSLHADAPMYEEDPLSLLQTAVTRKTREGTAIGSNEKISVMDGLKSLTIYSAWQLHMEKK